MQTEPNAYPRSRVYEGGHLLGELIVEEDEHLE